MKGYSDFSRWALWRFVSIVHTIDYALLLPAIARLPLIAGYGLSALRGHLNGLVGRDWRSVALERRHVAQRSTAGYRMLFPEVSDSQLQAIVRERFATESREEFEGRLMASGRIDELNCMIRPPGFFQLGRRRKRGLLLLTTHFDSYLLGIAFLGKAGLKINMMASAITNDPRVNPAVSKHYFKKYRGAERSMNGGRILDRENGLRPFYQMLERGECLVILADAPAAAGGSMVTPFFLGARRKLAGGAMRIARKTGSDLGAFVCRCEEPGRYRLKGSPILDATDPMALDTVFGFLSDEILASPGRWWASDLLPGMWAADGAGDLNAQPE